MDRLSKDGSLFDGDIAMRDRSVAVKLRDLDILYAAIRRMSKGILLLDEKLTAFIAQQDHKD